MTVSVPFRGESLARHDVNLNESPLYHMHQSPSGAKVLQVPLCH